MNRVAAILGLVSSLLAFSLGAPSASAAAYAQPGDEAVRNRMLSEARDKAVDFENSGALHEAVEQWWIVDALDPSANDGQRNVARLENRIQSLVADSLARGLKAQAQGRVAQSQQALLLVLQLAPGHSEALKALRAIETENMLRELRKRGAEGPAAAPIPTS
jgi:hypothetical protein